MQLTNIFSEASHMTHVVCVNAYLYFHIMLFEQLSCLFIRTGQLHCYSSEVMGVYSLDFTLNGLS